MHLGSYEKMAKFVNEYLTSCLDKEIKILDVGSQDVNGSYKGLFSNTNWKYYGCDMVEGNNVEIILKDVYNWSEVKTNSFDVVISGQCFEHIEYFWITMSEIARVLKYGGVCCVIAPSSGYEHKFPIDCWRFYPDGFSALAKFVGLETLNVYTQWDYIEYSDKSGEWHDTVLVCRKPKMLAKDKIRFFIKNKLLTITAKL